MSLAIEVENVSKLYRLGQIGTGTLSHDLNRLWHRIRGKGDPYAQIGEINNRTSMSDVKFVWALKDISFTVEQGDIVGIVGRNGAGKSTLLKILSKVTGPTSGFIGYDGRIASLLEVGTGFHPELTGVENIFMNGTILGMKRHEIKSKLDEILEFAGVARYADTPVKRYSSGMVLRLAFAVAAHLEAEILIVDEVLAVGDSEFQKKAVGKMQDVSKNSGKTVLFVSHNLPTLKSLCKSGVLLETGMVKHQGTIGEVVDLYNQKKVSKALIKDKIHYYQDRLKVNTISINGEKSCSISQVKKKLFIDLDIEFFDDTRFELDIHILKNEQAIASFAGFVFNNTKTFSKGRYQFQYDISLPEMRSGNYMIDLYFTDPYTCWFAVSTGVIELEVVNEEHDTFLNNPNLKWGAVLLNGKVEPSIKTEWKDV